MKNEYWEACSKLGVEGNSWGRRLEFDKRGSVDDVVVRWRERERMTREFSFAIPSPDVLAEIAKYSPILEVGAGTGYWAALLKDAGADVVATDLRPPKSGRNHWHKKEWTEVLEEDAVPAILRRPERNVFVCWPYMEEVAYHAAKNLAPGRHLIYIGEGSGGCTANDDFFELVEGESFEPVAVRSALPQWDYIHDELNIWRKK